MWRGNTAPEPPPAHLKHLMHEVSETTAFSRSSPRRFGAHVNIGLLRPNLRPDSVWIPRWRNFSETTSPYPTSKVNLIHLCVFEKSVKMKNHSEQSLVSMDVLAALTIKWMLWCKCTDHLATQIHCLTCEEMSIFHVSVAPATALLTNVMFGADFLIQVIWSPAFS